MVVAIGLEPMDSGFRARRLYRHNLRYTKLSIYFSIIAAILLMAPAMAIIKGRYSSSGILSNMIIPLCG